MKRDSVYLSHIRDATRRIQEYTQGGQTAFMDSALIQDAVIRNLEIIGEATKALSPEFRAKHPSIPWSSMAGMRDVLIHGYMGVDLEIVWDVVSVRLNPIVEEIEQLLGETLNRADDDEIDKDK